MQIQSSINQMISLTGVLAQMNPTLRARAESKENARQLTEKKEKMSKATDIASELNLSHDPDAKVAGTIFEEAFQHEIELAKREFFENPTQETGEIYGRRTIALQRFQQERAELEQSEQQELAELERSEQQERAELERSAQQQQLARQEEINKSRDTARLIMQDTGVRWNEKDFLNTVRVRQNKNTGGNV